MKRTIITILFALIFCSFSHAQEIDKSAILSQARQYRSIYMTDKAIEILQPLIDETSSDLDEEVMTELSECYIQAGDYAKACDIYADLSKAYPDNLVYKVKFLTVAFRDKDYMKSAMAGTELLKTDTIPALIILTADSYNQLGQEDNALPLYNLSLEIKPDNLSVVSKASDLYFKKKQYSEVIDMTLRYLEIDPLEEDVREILGTAYYLKGEYKNAIDVFEKMKEDDIDGYNIRYINGRSLIGAKKYKDGISELEKAWQIDSSDFNLALLIGTQCIEHVGIDRAKPWLEKTIEKLTPDPSLMARIYREMAKGHYDVTEFKEAITYYLKSMEYEKLTNGSYANLACSYFNLKDWKNAQKYYDIYFKNAKPGTAAYNYHKNNMDIIKQELFMLEKK